MYDSYPEYDVPQNNIIQRFFGQRWSAIVIEILMTIVISVAAGRAFEFFGPLDASAETTSDSHVAETVPQDTLKTKAGIPLGDILVAAIDYADNRQYAEAAAMFDLLIAAEPAQGLFYLSRASANSQLGFFTDAYRDTSIALELEPQLGSANISLCWYAGELGEYEIALGHCNAVLELPLDRYQILAAIENRCWVYVEMGEYDAALADCYRVLSEYPDCSVDLCALAHYNLGRIMAEQGEIAKARSHFELAFEHGPAFNYVYPKMYLEMAKFYDRLDFQRLALRNYRQYVGYVGESADSAAQSRISVLQGAG